MVLVLLEERSLLAAVLKRAEEEEEAPGQAGVVVGREKDETGLPSEEITARRTERLKPFIRKETRKLSRSSCTESRSCLVAQGVAGVT
jgi:hypothetical protein